MSLNGTGILIVDVLEHVGYVNKQIFNCHIANKVNKFNLF